MSEANPFESPQTVVPDADKRVAYCRQLLQIRDRNGQVSGLVAVYWQNLLWSSIVLACSSVFLLWFSFEAGLFVTGISVGTIVAQVSYFWQYASFWPMTDEIIDWHKVESIADGVAEN
jgi:hypothetical protein